MQLALQTYSLHLAFGRHPDCQTFPNKLTLAECFKKARRWGFAGVQLDPMHLDGSQPEYGKELKSQADREGLFLELGVHGFERTHVLRQLEFAEALGVRIIRIFDTVGLRPRDNAEIAKKLEFIRTEVESLLPSLEKKEMVLCWENHADYNTDEQLWVLGKVHHPCFRACIDLGNSMLFLESPLETVERLAPFAGSCHLKDYDRTGTTFGFKYFGTALGTGIIPLHDIMDILKSETQLTHLVYEQSIEPASTDQEEAVRNEEAVLLRSLDYARGELGLTIL